MRIGLSLDELRAQEQRGRLQVALLVLLLLVLGAVGTGAVIVRQNLALLGDAYANIQTYSSRILAQMTDAVVATDPAGTIEVFNQAAEALFGVGGEQVRGQHLRDVWPHEAVDRALAGEELVGLACRFTDTQGRERTLSLSSAQVYNASGEVETIVLVIQDLSEKVALEADLRRRDRLASMGALASGVAPRSAQPTQCHQCDRAAAAARVYSAHRRGRISPANPSRCWRGRAGQSHHSAVPRIGPARPRLPRTRVDLASILERAAETVEPQMLAAGLRLERDFAGVGEAQVDADQLHQALLNLLVNAVEATGRRTHLARGSVSARGLGGDRRG